MCGIAGHVSSRAGSREALEAQLATVAHRGPDASGVHLDGRIAIGQNRLAVIDLETGDPPITNEDGAIGVALNGEIYNYSALRARLLEEGHRLTSTGDTEVIAHLTENHGPVELARELDGMFAFAVCDGPRGRLVLGRDRLGKKPLYYWHGGGELVFGSEIKALLAHPAVPRELDPGALPAYLTFGYVPTPRTFYAGIRSLPPGCVLVAEGGGEPRIERYWEPPRASAGGAGMSLPEAAGLLRPELETAVERRLVSDVPLGAFLSGGIDSTVIVGLMSRVARGPVKTFTIGFDDEFFDERPHARAVAKLHGTEHTEFVVRPDAVELIERLVWHHDQPFGDSSAIPTYLLAELTREHVTVALSGDGGDELFAGYERFSAATMVERYRRVPAPVRHAIRALARRIPEAALRRRASGLRRFSESADRGLPDAYLGWLGFFDEEARAALLPGADEWALEDYRAIWRASAGQDVLARLLDLNLRTYLVDDLLVKADRMSMAHALEVRSPFLDAALVELSATLPPDSKLKGWSRKRVLREATRDLVPDEIAARRKRGFGVPLDRWFREGLRSYARSMLGSGARVREHLEPAAIDRLLAEHDSGRRLHGQALWTLLTLEVFLRREGW